MVNVFAENCAAGRSVCRNTRRSGWKLSIRRFLAACILGGGIKGNFRAFDSESDSEWPGDYGLFDASVVEIEAVATVEIADAPNPILKNNFGMNAAYVIVLDGEFAVVSAANPERNAEHVTLSTIPFDLRAYFEGR
jgi:hypothetical protein